MHILKAPSSVLLWMVMFPRKAAGLCMTSCRADGSMQLNAWCTPESSIEEGGGGGGSQLTFTRSDSASTLAANLPGKDRRNKGKGIVEGTVENA
jgi:hypothetical protein